MGRRTNRAELISLVEKLRKEIPDIVLRTTLITGFPGETEEELISGDIVPVRITGANEYDLMGDVIYADEFTE